jgi:phage tail sheath protein FI
VNEYLAPGVYVEEVRAVPRRIEPVDPSVTALVGSAGQGPLDEVVEVRSAQEAVVVFGDGSWLAVAVADFLAAGGRTALVARASTTKAGLAALVGRDVRLLVVESDQAVACSWCGENRAFLVAAAGPGGVLPSGLGRDAAAYHPGLVGADGSTRSCAPAVAGLVVRTDRERGVWKAPAGRDASLPVDLAETTDVDALAARGVNSLRRMEGRVVVWGARTAAWQDPEWRYVPAWRTVLTLEESIDRGLAWVVFEPNGPGLWTQVRACVENFLTTWWLQGALLGTTADEAFFVRADPSTMTQADLDAGRLVVLVGVALLRPAEFSVLRVGLRTADAV